METAHSLLLFTLTSSIIIIIILWGVISWMWYQYIVHRQQTTKAQQVNKHDYRHIVLIIAHPDDECMFFGPLLAELHACSIYVICLSAGYVTPTATTSNETRIHELHAALRLLLARDVNYSVFIGPMHDTPHQEPWPIEPIITYLQQQLIEINKSCSIDCIVTFDEWGVSGHPHHRSVHTAVAQIVLLNKEKKLPLSMSWLLNVPIYILHSVPLWKKYSAWLLLPCNNGCHSIIIRRKVNDDGKVALQILNSSPRRVWTAMRAHRSQLLWFRRLYLLTSQYVYFNCYHQMFLAHRE
jgi:N-acetylglucosaminylphosphatidylinositol deacetylase